MGTVSGRPPKVAVIIPAYNAAATIERAIQSVERQTFQDWEIVVADDASTDETVQLARRHARVTVASLPRNSGAAEARDLGVRTATADVIALLDADDEAHPERLEIQLQALQMLESRHRRPVLLYTGRLCITPGGRRWLRGGAQAASGALWLTDLEHILTGNHYLMGATLMMRRDAWLDLGGQALTDVDQELDIYARAANRGHVVAHIGLPLYYQHITPNSRQHFVRDRAMRFERILQLWDPSNPATIPDRAIDAELHRRMCHAIYSLFTRLFIRRGFFAQARELAQKARMYGPLQWNLRLAVRVPWLYRLLDAVKGRLAETIYAWQSRDVVRALDAGQVTLKARVVDPQLREILGAVGFR